MPSLRLKDAEIYYEVMGEGPATVVLAHGVGGNHASWYQQVPVFARSHRVVTFDHRGFGRSTDPEGHGRSRFVEDLLELLDALEVDKASLVGQSMGGGTVVGFAVCYPERVSALVVADSLFGFALPEAIQAKFDEARARADAMEQSERALGAWFRENEPERLHLYQALASFNETNRKTLGGTSVTYAPEKLAEGGLPVLFIVGQEDGLVPPELVHELASLIQGALVVEISSAGHSPYFEKPVEFNESVLSFLQAFGGVRQSRAWLSNTAGYRKVD